MEPYNGLVELGQQLRRRRRELKLTQKQVAERFGVEQPTVGRWENAQRRPDLAQLPAIADFLDLDLSAVVHLAFGPPDASDASDVEAQISELREASEALANEVAALTRRLDEMTDTRAHAPRDDSSGP